MGFAIAVVISDALQLSEVKTHTCVETHVMERKP
jgi:hypothetical protein